MQSKCYIYIFFPIRIFFFFFLVCAENVFENSFGQGDETLTIRTIDPLVDPNVTKVFSASSVDQGATAFLTITVENINNVEPMTNVSFVDELPADLTPTAVLTSGNRYLWGGKCLLNFFLIFFFTFLVPPTCGVPVFDAGSTPNTFSLDSVNGGTVAAGGTCQYILQFAVSGSAVPGTRTNNAFLVNSTLTNPVSSTDVSVVIEAQPNAQKSFSVVNNEFVAGQSGWVTIRVQNSNDTPLTNVQFMDQLPVADFTFEIATTPTACAETNTGVCGAGCDNVVPTYNTGATTPSLDLTGITGGTIPANTVCLYSFRVTAIASPATASPNPQFFVTADGGVSLTVSEVPYTIVDGNVGLGASKKFIAAVAGAIDFKDYDNPEYAPEGTLGDVSPNTVFALMIQLAVPGGTSIGSIGFTEVLPDGLTFVDGQTVQCREDGGGVDCCGDPVSSPVSYAITDERTFVVSGAFLSSGGKTCEYYLEVNGVSVGGVYTNPDFTVNAVTDDAAGKIGPLFILFFLINFL
jgi:uncharacterized repeat protein (TIGR01451 family)